MANENSSAVNPSRTPRSSAKPPSKPRKALRHVDAAVVCNLATYFGLPDVGYQPHYGKKREKR